MFDTYSLFFKYMEPISIPEMQLFFCSSTIQIALRLPHFLDFSIRLNKKVRHSHQVCQIWFSHFWDF